MNFPRPVRPPSAVVRLFVLALLGPCLAACGSEPPAAPPTSLDLAGFWLLRDSSVNRLAIPGGPRENSCVMSERPVEVQPIEGSADYIAFEHVGGTLRCRNDGEVLPERNLDAFTRRVFFVVRRGDSVDLAQPSMTALYYTGRIVNAGLLAGRRDSTVDGRSGTWSMSR